MNRTETQAVIDRQRRHFLSGATRDVSQRRAALEALRAAFVRHQSLVVEAVHADMRRAALETCTMDIGMVLADVEFALAHLDEWATPKGVPVPEQPGAHARLYPEAYGVVLIQSAWNYPIMQLFGPLVGALAAGNTAVLRPAATSPHCARAAATIVSDTFAPELVSCIVGPSTLTSEAIDAPVDYVFFTGSPKVGRIIMAQASKHLIPVTLELGGKSPAVVDRSADLALAARKIAWGKLSNAGQICLSVDHAYVHVDVKDAFIEQLTAEFRRMVGDDAEQSPDLARIINDDNCARVASYVRAGRMAYGGRVNAATRFVEPTILVDVSEDDPVMQEELFGPVLPVLTFEDLDRWIWQQQRKPKPLGLYVFATDPTVSERIVRSTSSGGVCVNDTMVHSVSAQLPFGGVGNSGMGAYHGKATFDTFTHQKPVLDGTTLGMDWRYMPYAGTLEQLQRQMEVAS